MKRYPRDLLGYGEVPPVAAWPGNAKIAVQIVVNYEEGGERCVLHGDNESEAFLSEIPSAVPWPGQRHWNMESIYEYGARAGFWRIFRLLADTPVTVFGVATALVRAPEQVAAMKRAGWEIASHGLKWIDYGSFERAAERADMLRAVQIHEEVVGAPPAGWYTGRCSINTVGLAAELGNFAYVADSYGDDLPYWFRHGSRKQLIVPYTLDVNDMRFAVAPGFGSPDHFERYIKDSFDVLYAEGVAGAPKMMSIGLHCRLAGRPGRLASLERALAHIRAHDGVWFATRLQIAHHWAASHPATDGILPSQMDRDTFMAKFGEIFEHSEWIASSVFENELGPLHDTATGLHAAFARIFRSAGRQRQCDVLRAHPDLAGALARASRLTRASTQEQASVGLDALTDSERQTFTELNEAYKKKFAFPFIIAVRDHSKSTILEAFRRRLANSIETEFREACQQVLRIAEFRMRAKLK